jgi:hypothetical protein
VFLRLWQWEEEELKLSPKLPKTLESHWDTLPMELLSNGIAPRMQAWECR